MSHFLVIATFNFQSRFINFDSKNGANGDINGKIEMALWEDLILISFNGIRSEANRSLIIHIWKSFGNQSF
jgi:hypothetical protein